MVLGVGAVLGLCWHVLRGASTAAGTAPVRWPRQCPSHVAVVAGEEGAAAAVAAVIGVEVRRQGLGGLSAVRTGPVLWLVQQGPLLVLTMLVLLLAWVRSEADWLVAACSQAWPRPARLAAHHMPAHHCCYPHSLPHHQATLATPATPNSPAHPHHPPTHPHHSPLPHQRPACLAATVSSAAHALFPSPSLSTHPHQTESPPLLGCSHPPPYPSLQQQQ